MFPIFWVSWKRANKHLFFRPKYNLQRLIKLLTNKLNRGSIVERFSRAGPRGREWATLGVHPLSWLLSNNRLEEVCGTLTTGTFSSRLLLSNQDKGCTPSVAHSLPLPLGPALLNLWTVDGVYDVPAIDGRPRNLKGELRLFLTPVLTL